MIAALFVQKGGVYYGLEGVDPWDEERDARLYPGPHPVVAHPPCARWAPALAPLNDRRWGLKVGDDGGCFAFALESVRKYGGVLEHPAGSIAWRHFKLTPPAGPGWIRCALTGAWVADVWQRAYGHKARKRTWLYAVCKSPPPLNVANPPPIAEVSNLQWGDGRLPKLGKAEASRTPTEFRDLLLSIARSVNTASEAAKVGR